MINLRLLLNKPLTLISINKNGYVSFWQDAISLISNLQENKCFPVKQIFEKTKPSRLKNWAKIKYLAHWGKTRSQSKQRVSKSISTILGQNRILPHTYTAFFLSSWDCLICQLDGISEDDLQVM